MGKVGSGKYVQVSFVVEVPAEMSGESQIQECVGWIVSNFNVGLPVLDYLRTSTAGIMPPDQIPPELRVGIPKGGLKLS